MAPTRIGITDFLQFSPDVLHASQIGLSLCRLSYGFVGNAPNPRQMPVELLKLNLQLENLKVLYEDAMLNNESVDNLKRIKDQIELIEILIENRKELIRKNESSN